jgi:hypothetical protein
VAAVAVAAEEEDPEAVGTVAALPKSMIFMCRKFS